MNNTELLREAVALLKKAYPAIDPHAMDTERMTGNPASECWINTMVRSFTERTDVQAALASQASKGAGMVVEIEHPKIGGIAVCPFCAYVADVDTRTNTTAPCWSVQCGSCGAEGSVESTSEEAIKRWNTRVIKTALPEFANREAPEDLFDLIREWAHLPEGQRGDAARNIIGCVNRSYSAGVADGRVLGALAAQAQPVADAAPPLPAGVEGIMAYERSSHCITYTDEDMAVRYQQGRADALKEAAEICDDLHHSWRWDNEPDSASGPRSCAAAIRALAAKPAE